MSSIDNIVLVMCTGNSLVARTQTGEQHKNYPPAPLRKRTVAKS